MRVFACPECGAPGHRTHIVDTRPANEGRRRRRECVNCSTRWTTYEINEERLRELLATERRAKKLRHRVTRENERALQQRRDR